MVVGWQLGLGEIGIYFFISYTIKKQQEKFKSMDAITFYWMTMTVLTMIWESAFVYNYEDITIFSQNLIENRTHVWTSNYDLTYILPWKLSYIFYGEYGAYADREYMILLDDWSRLIESTHAILCGLFAFLFLYYKSKGFFINKDSIMLGISMGSQLMNSILYMGNYFIQLNEGSSVNFCSIDFPCGPALLSRAFMYVNIFWTIMPAYVIIKACKNVQFPDIPQTKIDIKYSKKKNRENDYKIIKTALH